MKLFGPLSLLQLIILHTCIFHVVGAEFIRVCYFASWRNLKTSPLAKFDVENIDPAICTHLIYAFGKIDVTNASLAAFNTANIPHYKSFNDLKIKNSKLKTLLSIGSRNDSRYGFIEISSNDTLLKVFANNAVSFLRTHAFDGVDLMWVYPNKTTKSNFIKILKSLRSAFDNENTSSRLLLTIAAPAGAIPIKNGFNVPEINKYVDLVNIMTYGYTDRNSKVTAFYSPLFSSNRTKFNPALSTNWTVQFYRRLGLRYSKMVVGFTGLGRRLVLRHISQTKLGSPTTGEQRKGPDYEFDASLAYPEICIMLQNKSSKRVFDNVQKMPYLVNGDNWVGYEDVQSIGIKTEWAIQIGAAGMMFWSLDRDDFSGAACKQGKYPLMSKIISVASRTTTTDASTTTSFTSTSSIQWTKVKDSTQGTTVEGSTQGTTVEGSTQGTTVEDSTQETPCEIEKQSSIVGGGSRSRLMALGFPIVVLTYLFSLMMI